MIERAFDLRPLIQTLTSIEKDFRSLFLDPIEINSLKVLVSLLKELDWLRIFWKDQLALIPNIVLIFEHLQCNLEEREFNKELPQLIKRTMETAI